MTEFKLEYTYKDDTTGQVEMTNTTTFSDDCIDDRYGDMGILGRVTIFLRGCGYHIGNIIEEDV